MLQGKSKRNWGECDTWSWPLISWAKSITKRITEMKVSPEGGDSRCVGCSSLAVHMSAFPTHPYIRRHLAFRGLTRLSTFNNPFQYCQFSCLNILWPKPVFLFSTKRILCQDKFHSNDCKNLDFFIIYPFPPRFVTWILTNKNTRKADRLVVLTTTYTSPSVMTVLIVNTATTLLTTYPIYCSLISKHC